jgi:uncharacterized damage-inducible protein DinB
MPGMTWTAPAIERRNEPFEGDERPQLQGWLDFHRDTLLFKCAGLGRPELIRAAVEPSSLTLLGLVRHMADVERAWFRSRAAGLDLPALYSTDDNLDGDFDDVATADPEADFAAFRAECAAADEAVKDLPLEHTFVRMRQGTTPATISMRWVYLHMIEEYARHNGHADLIRERIDGATGD